ncbi:MAG: flagellar basal body P-ring protein FlgI [Rickettsiaceae bacterium]|nr:flagellar basal body P-ring protein FlgI [Rickettsiaceae bacterium]
MNSHFKLYRISSAINLLWEKLFSILSVSVILSCSFAANGTRIKDIATVQGVRENLLVGYGIVVGLNGTGDNLKNAVFTQKGLEDFLEKLGINIQGANPKTKNIAAVMVTAELPAFAKQGTRIDVKVSAMGDAKSLRNGTLLVTPLLGADGNVYSVAQGPIAIPEFEPASANVKTLAANPKLDNNGYIQNGGIVENELNFDFKKLSSVRLTLQNPDFSSSLAIADAINNTVPGNNAESIDPATVQIIIPNYKKNDVMQFIAEIENLEIKTDYKAKIVIHEATGTIVIGDNVQIRPVAIAQGNLVVNINPDPVQVTTTSAKQDQINKVIDRRRGKEIMEIDGAKSLSEVVAGLNKLGVWPRDIINVLYNMKAVGAIDATLEVR